MERIEDRVSIITTVARGIQKKMAVLPTFTLDTNCIIDLDEDRPDAEHIRHLLRAHREGRASVHVIAIMASEKQKAGGYLSTFDEFTKRLQKLGLSDLPHVLPLTYFDVCFFDHSLWPSKETTELDRKIREVLFPEMATEAPEVDADRAHTRWKNAICDVQALWSHIHADNLTFVTSDANFHQQGKKEALIALGAGQILRPWEAAALLENTFGP